jgi:hypothetical protein
MCRSPDSNSNRSGLRLSSGTWPSGPSLRRVRPPGNLLTEARTIDGVHHTLTVWRDRAFMVRYIRTGPHLEAMRVFPKIATGKVLGFSTDAPPDWPEARRLWEKRALPVQRVFKD